ncbi:DUF6233 domain-containing protein [Actinacidiphila glaucinigra]|uniref:DUF6233 domain-containing protein n=1 Tax=Actinacidiphila glaucinigra TaxID=235986 RepID=UPI0036878913
MHDDLPEDLDDLQLIQEYLDRQITRALAQHDRPGLHEELPANRRQVVVVGTFLREQAKRVRQRAHYIETGEEPWRAEPAPGWILQFFAKPDNRPSRSTLHRSDCPFGKGKTLTVAEAIVAMRDVPEVDECPQCRPYEELRRRSADLPPAPPLPG